MTNWLLNCLGRRRPRPPLAADTCARIMALPEIAELSPLKQGKLRLALRRIVP